MNTAAAAGGLVAGLISGAIAMAISLIPNTLAMYAVMKLEMGEGKQTEKATVYNCFLCVLLLTVVAFLFWLIYGLGWAFVPTLMAIAGWILFAGWIGTCKAIIEGLFEITEGSATILFLYICFLMLIKIYLVPVITGEAVGIEEEDSYSVMASSSSRGLGGMNSRSSTPEPLGFGQVAAYEGHEDTVYDAIFLMGNRVATASSDDTIRIWDRDKGTQLNVLKGHAGDVISLSGTADGSLIVSGSEDSTVRLWDTTTGESIKTFTGHMGTVNSVAIHPDGTYVVSGGEDKIVRFWDVATGQNVPYQAPKGEIVSLEFTPDAGAVFIVSNDPAVRIVDFVNQREVWFYNTDLPMLVSGTMCPDGRHVALGDEQGLVIWVDMMTSKSIGSIRGHDSDVLAMSFANEAGRLATIGWGGDARIWGDIAGGKFLNTEAKVEHATWRGGTGVRFSRDGKYLLTTGSDDKAKLWDMDKVMAGPAKP